MRKTIMTRSIVAAATIAIGSAALAATPANAAAANGVTRDQILTAVNGVRAAQAADTDYTLATTRALSAIIIKGCDVNISGGEYYYNANALPMNAGDDADGLLIRARVETGFSNHSCTIAAVAATADSFTLNGSVVVSGNVFDEPTDNYVSKELRNQALSGDAFVTSPIDTDDLNLSGLPGASASGNATKTTVTTTTVKVADKKTTSEKKKAKAKYTKSLKSAKKSYAKALDKAGKSKSKKAKAKKAYAAKRATAKATYRYAIANYKLVTKSTSSTENRPFSITTPAQVQELPSAIS